MTLLVSCFFAFALGYSAAAVRRLASPRPLPGQTWRMNALGLVEIVSVRHVEHSFLPYVQYRRMGTPEIHECPVVLFTQQAVLPDNMADATGP